MSDLLQPPHPPDNQGGASAGASGGDSGGSSQTSTSVSSASSSPVVCDLSGQGLKFARQANIFDSTVVGQVIIAAGEESVLKDFTKM